MTGCIRHGESRLSAPRGVVASMNSLQEKLNHFCGLAALVRSAALDCGEGRVDRAGADIARGARSEFAGLGVCADHERPVRCKSADATTSRPRR
jgi:hypothetical protein